LDFQVNIILINFSRKEKVIPQVNFVKILNMSKNLKN